MPDVIIGALILFAGYFVGALIGYRKGERDGYTVGWSIGMAYGREERDGEYLQGWTHGRAGLMPEPKRKGE